jgi:hypothetical protein
MMMELSYPFRRSMLLMTLFYIEIFFFKVEPSLHHAPNRKVRMDTVMTLYG